MHFSFFKKEQTNRLWSVSQRDAEHIANVITKGKYEWIEYIYIYIYISCDWKYIWKIKRWLNTKKMNEYK